ncbi:FAD-dependent monooxygenase [Geodermatophilus ruber]|uniref:2-polyprenyl-6-methoxyphenol hydroxylase n=1 Tax=Geodermatophilus ruber TaxID=504800 RepID=A0A1I3ZB50_9ACTN|nr:FAD-dependent monooxygenase [Geodermatophilus ruber]SFK41235.1 2-polyprenyl-6-methoxyphenol hydroxylase [Geodermatophilus ruber]
MKIVCVGAGPAGLYFAISAKRSDPSRDITVLERDPQGATYGWGVVYWDDMLDLLYVNDPESGRALRRASTLWKDQEIHVSGGVAHLGGYGFAMQRAEFLETLVDRARRLGVTVEYDHPVEDLTPFADADLIVAADGAGSRTRQLHGDHFGTRVETGANPYIWLGTDMVFPSFVFAFEKTPAGWLWFHAYPSSGTVSTCIVECTETTWRALGMDERDEDDGIRLLAQIFERSLQGHSLISQSRGEPARWLRFKEVSNRTWWHDNVVLIGDAAHTTHFTIGSGTRLAVIDAVELVRSLDDFPGDLAAALRDFDHRARPNLERVQRHARGSMNWYEHADDYLDGRDAVDAAYAMATRNSPPSSMRERVFRAEQLRPARLVQGAVDTAQRLILAARRGELPFVPSWHPGPPPAGREQARDIALARERAAR